VSYPYRYGLMLLGAGMDDAEIAKELGLPVEAVGPLLTVARAKVRAALSEPSG
jgi:DNA-directed RNA polymerase specialized sigma24 family protein